jgi:serine/threonine-protein kinase
VNAAPGVEDDSPTQTAGGAQLPHPAPFSTWGDLRIVEELGRGAYGCVYRAFDDVLAREVALKIIPIESSDPAVAAGVLREGRMLARLRHRNVVTVYRAQQIGNEIGVCMELVRGRSLASMLRESGPLAADEAALIGISLCQALSAVHAAGLLHRDVKAHNVMRESGGRIVLMDFGAGREIAARQSGWSDMAGTPLYMAPEVLAGGEWSASADLYSLGVLLFFLVAGRHPIEGATLPDIAIAHARGRRSLLADCRPDLPESFVRVVERAIAPTVAQRYQTAGEMLHDLTAAVSSAGRRSRLEEGDAQSPPTWARSGAWRWTAIAGAALGFVWLLGILTSLAFNQTLGRTQGFANESPLDWLVWGARSLLGPVSLVGPLLIIWVIGSFLWGVLSRLIPPIDRAVSRTRDWAHRVAARIGLSDRTSRAQFLLVMEAVAVAGVLWRFRDFIDACFGFLDRAPADRLALLAPDAEEPLGYRFLLSVLLVLTSAALLYFMKQRPHEPPVARTTVTASALVVLVVLLFVTVPFRLLYQANFQRVDAGQERCYQTGQRGSELLLFCPDTIPRIRVVSSSDPSLRKRPLVESVFTPNAAAR